MRILHLPRLIPEAEEKLRAAGDPTIWKYIRADIDAGRSQLFLCPDDTYIVLALDDTEIIFVAMAGKNAVGAVETVLEIARVLGLQFVRFHTARKGMTRLLKQYKPMHMQSIYRMAV